jgi:hypothetical protein
MSARSWTLSGSSLVVKRNFFLLRKKISKEAKQCPHCERWALKDSACSYIFACGLDEKNIFHKDMGCGKSWCWTCGKKYCGYYYKNGIKCTDAKDSHTDCCKQEEGFQQSEYCEGGHSSHCYKRW